MVHKKAKQAKTEGYYKPSICNEHYREIKVGVQNKHQRGQCGNPCQPDYPAVDNRRQKHNSREPYDIVRVHKSRRIRKQAIIKPVCKGGKRTPKSAFCFGREPPRRNSIVPRYLSEFSVAWKTKGFKQDG